VDDQSVAKKRFSKQTSTVRKLCFLCCPRRAKHGDTESLLPGNAAVNMRPQKWETVFSVGSVQRSCLKDKRRNDSVQSYFSNFALECAIRVTQENQLWLKRNVKHQLLLYADGVNLLEGNINAINKNIEVLIDASKEVSLEKNTEKAIYMLVSRDQNSEKIHNVNIAHRSYRNVTDFKYF
jgi:hypothetical protein